MSLLLAAGSAPPPSSAPLWAYSPQSPRLDWQEPDRPVSVDLNALYFWRTTAALSNALWFYGMGKNPTEWDEPFRQPRAPTDALYFWRSPTYGLTSVSSLSPVLVTEDTIYQRTDTNSALLFFNRSTAQQVGQPLTYAKRTWDFSEDPRSTGINQDILFFWRTQIPATPTSGNFTLGALSLILVSDEPIRPPNDYSGSLFFWRTPTPVIVQTPDLVQGQVPGWVPGGRPPKKPRGNKGLGPVMREGQVFGESYPPSPFILQPGEKAQLAPSPGMQQDLFIASPEELHAALLALMSTTPRLLSATIS
jgi:hypothetical protein